MKKHVGSRIQQERKAKKLRQSELAQLTGKSVETISNIERGAVWTSLNMLESLGEALGVPIYSFFDEYDGRSKKSAERLILEAEVKILLQRMNTQKLSMVRDLAKSLNSAG